MKKDNIFKILFLSLPRIVYDRSLHDRCTDFGETAQYIINHFKGNSEVTVELYDASIPVAPLRNIYRLFSQNYDIIIFFADVTDAPLTLRLCRVLKYISPQTKNIIYGDATLTIPQYFYREPFDAFHINGDQEAALLSFIQFILTKNEKNLTGLAVRIKGEFKIYNKNYRIAPEEWALPPIDLLPLAEYKWFVQNYKKAKYACSIYVSKGCPKRCPYCLCGFREGFVERRRPVKTVVDFLEKYQDQFDLFKLHSADFMFNTSWVEEFCNEIISRGLTIKWKTTVCFDSMNYDLVKLCAEAGCYGLGFGIETFYRHSNQGMKLAVDRFKVVMAKLAEIPINYKGYIMLGVENQSVSDVYYTIDLLQQYNVKVRPSTYTPFYLLRDMSIAELDRINLEEWNKKEFFPMENTKINEKEAYEIWLTVTFREKSGGNDEKR